MPNQTDTNTDTTDPATRSFVDRYVALWNEPAPEARRATIRELWAEDGGQVLLSPPQEIRDAAARVGFPAPNLEVRGYEGLERRVTRAYEEFVAPGQFRFRPRCDGDRHGNVIRFAWEMVATADGQVAGSGQNVVVLDDEGRIRTDQQIVD